MRLSQAKLQSKIESVAINGQRPAAEPLLSQVGYGPAVLAGIVAEVVSWQANRRQVKTLLGEQKAATLAQREARKMARLELADLAQTVRLLFGEDEPTLTKLGLLPPPLETATPQATPNQAVAGATQAAQNLSESRAAPGLAGDREAPNGLDYGFLIGSKGVAPTETGPSGDKATSTAAAPKSGNKSGRSRQRRSESLAADIERWKLLCANIAQLSQSQRQRLAVADWSAERVARAAALVVALAEAHDAQQAAVDTYRNHSALTRRQEKKLRKWYSEAAGLLKMAIKRLEPEDAAHFKTMLAL